MANNPVGWFEIYVQDMVRAKKFYEAVFECQMEDLSSAEVEMWAFPMDMERYGAPGALAKMEGVASGGNSIMVYFSCQNCAVEDSRAPANGGSIVKDKFSIGSYGFIALINDTEGNMIGLHSHQ